MRAPGALEMDFCLHNRGIAPIYGTSSFGRIDYRSRAGQAQRQLTTSLLNIDRLSGRDDALPRRLACERL